MENEKVKPEERIITVPLEVRLTEKELKTASKALAEAINKRTMIESQLETFKAQKKAEVAAQDAIISATSVLVNSEKEFRMIECKVEYDFAKKGVKTTVRLDTGEIINTQPISNDERQQFMPGLKPDPKSK